MIVRRSKSLRKRLQAEVKESVKYVLFLAVFFCCLVALLISSLRPEYEQIEDQIVALADAHLRYETIQPGWSFPGRVWSDSVSLDIPKEQLLAHAKIRGYEEICPASLPGQICPESGEVLVRGGMFPEGVQPDNNGEWTRPKALEPILIGWLIAPNGEIREHLPIESAPQVLLSAIIAAEDDAFYEHGGVNYKGAARATLANIRGGGFNQGASTITMQVVRALTQEREKTMIRKFREAASAIALDQHLGKEKILQIYLDAPYLGQYGSFSICGFQSAARYYYGIDAVDLNLSQAATLAAILPAPAKYSPIEFPERARKQRDRVLRRMRNLGWNPAEVKEALLEPIVAHGFQVPEPRYPAYMQATRTWLEDRLNPTDIYGRGLQVFTSLDVVTQETGDKVLAEGVEFLKQNIGKRFASEQALQAVAAVLDSQSGELVAVHGGDVAMATDFNRATQALRQAGSSLKPLVYAMAFSELDDEGMPTWKASDTVPNHRRTFENTNGWKPRNLSGYTKTASLAYGLSWSQNVATASLLEQLGGPEKLIDFAKKFDFDTTYWKEEMGLSLGQAEVTPLEMSRMVSTVIREGRLASGAPVTLARDIRGKHLIDEVDTAERVMTTESAALTRDLMRLVITLGTGGSTRGRAGRYGFEGPAIGKTGTTDSEKDLWFVGGTAHYSAALWLGYDQPERIGAAASDLAAPLWGWWARAVHEHFEHQAFPGMQLPTDVICNTTGKRANGTCRRAWGVPFLDGTQPPKRCPIQHPPPDPNKKKYKGLWGRKAEAEQKVKEAEALKKAQKEAANAAASDTNPSIDEAPATTATSATDSPPSKAIKPEASDE